MPIVAMACSAENPSFFFFFFFLHLSFVDSTCILHVIILGKWIPGYLRLFVHSVTFLLKEIAGIACPTALLLTAHHRDYAFLACIDFGSLCAIVTPFPAVPGHQSLLCGCHWLL